MGFILCLVILALSLGLALGLGQRHHVNDPIIDLGYTKYKGRSFSDGTSHWFGVRYAAPPVGNLRFAAPKDPPRNDSTQPATKVSMSLKLEAPEKSADIFIIARPSMYPNAHRSSNLSSTSRDT